MSKTLETTKLKQIEQLIAIEEKSMRQLFQNSPRQSRKKHNKKEQKGLEKARDGS